MVTSRLVSRWALTWLCLAMCLGMGIHEAHAQQAATTEASPAIEATVPEVKPHVALDTNQGRIVLELFPEKAPLSVENFLRYVNEGFYDNTTFHRVIRHFLIQASGYNSDLQRAEQHEPIRNEANNGLKNERGTVAVGRKMEPHSGTSQFFINVVDNPKLDFISEQNGYTWGYAVFGKVIEGMEVVDAIRKVPTGAQGDFTADVPIEPVIILKAHVLPAAENDEAGTKATL